MKDENTHLDNQNGVVLGETGTGAENVKLSLSVTHLTSQRMLSIGDQDYIIPSGGDLQQHQQQQQQHQRFTTSGASTSTSTTEQNRMRVYGISTSEGLQIPSSSTIHSFVTSNNAFALGYPVSSSEMGYTKVVPASSQQMSNAYQYHNAEFTIAPMENTRQPPPRTTDGAESSKREQEGRGVKDEVEILDEDLDSSVPESIDDSAKVTGTDEDETSSDEDDVHVCGRCKQIFHTLNEYMAHKSSKVCKSSRSTSKHPQTSTSPVKHSQTSTSPVIPTAITNHHTLPTQLTTATSTSNDAKTLNTPNHHLTASSPSPVKVSIEAGGRLLRTPNKNMDLMLDNQSAVETTVKSVMSISNIGDSNDPTSPVAMTPVKVQPISNQNILETAAKNTIFRDSFISMEEPEDVIHHHEMEDAEHDIPPQDMPPPLISPSRARHVASPPSVSVPSHPPTSGLVAEEEVGGKKVKPLPLVKVPRGTMNKKRRGRPPKSNQSPSTTTKKIIASTTATTINDDVTNDGNSNENTTISNDSDDRNDDNNNRSNAIASVVNEDSPPKAKRKSRPPRRHKPDQDLSEEPLDIAMEDDPENFDNFAGMEEGVVPTVESIQKLFSGASANRGRGGRGKKRGPHPLHRCPICQLLFPSRLTMTEHKRKHSKLFRCKICNEGFYTEEKLDKHLAKETHSYPCESCERVLVSKQALIRHRMSHSDKLFKCDECARAFKTQRDLKNHVVGMHSETRDFVCQVCNKGFSRREKLKRHLMIHAPDRPIFTCPFKNHVGCDKTFYRKDKLTRHLYSHSKVKPFKCEQCDKSFARTDNLREHIRSHTGVFRYYCTVCGKGQPGPKKFLQHMLKQHNIDNADIPKPFEELAPEPLIQQHKAVVQAETDAKNARAATNLKKEREKTGQQHKLRKEELEAQELHVEPHHVALATMNNLGLHGTTLLAPSPTSQTTQVSAEPQTIVQTRAPPTIESLYTINQHASATSPQFQITRHVPEGMVRHINESILRENLAREGLVRGETTTLTRDTTLTAAQAATLTRQLTEAAGGAVTEVRLTDGGAGGGSGSSLGRHVVESSHLTTESIRRQLSGGETTVVQQQGTREVVQDVQQTLSQGISVEAEGAIPVSTRGLQLLPHGVLPGNLQFTALLNSDLVAIGEAVIRNQNGIPTAIFPQKFGPAQ